ncbi:MAG: sigma 54-interacting transcriptional regulator [Deltaproteobacteria bacterium]|nr:sigma 54-interacting transcriptional regulator [Deltaproteobacteria bacterium]
MSDRFQNDVILSQQTLALLDELSVGAFTVDVNRRVKAMNLNAQALMGLKEVDVIDKDCREIFTGVPCMVDCVLQNKHSGAADEPDVEIVDENEARMFLTRMAIPVYDHNHRPAGCLTILQDHSPIADLIDRIHYEERTLKVILDNLDVGIFTVNRGGLITFFNNEAEKISGYNRRQVLGKPCSTLFGGQVTDDMCLFRESLEKGWMNKPRQGEIVTQDGEAVPIRTNYIALKNEKGAIIGGLATFHDLTLVRQLDQAMHDRYTFHDMIGKSQAMQKVFEKVEIVADADATILIEGPTGTGKDLLAKVIHHASQRSSRPFVKVNCAAIPADLLESELFGYARGAFTGAERDKPGRFNEADGGTIFLDEIGDLPLPLQAKLLRVLEDKEFYPLGSRHTQKVDVRIISATNRGLDKLVEKGLFREDLFYRLNVFRFDLPALEERMVDLPLLIQHILRRLCAARGTPTVDIARPAMEILLNRDYPGNVRELENILEHALIVSRESEILPRHLPDYICRPQKPAGNHDHRSAPRFDALQQEERHKIIEALARHNGNRTRAAGALGIDRSTLWRKMNRYKISKNSS